MTTIHVVGGVYREYCVHPRWNEVYGSAGRAALAIATMDTDTCLHSYFSPQTLDLFRQNSIWQERLTLCTTMVEGEVGFEYLHDMAVPRITGLHLKRQALEVREEHVVRFGMLEGTAIVHADWVVYDPQNENVAELYEANGSTANHLALVLNSWEASQMAGMESGVHPTVSAPVIAEKQCAEVVIVKMGPEGAYVWTEQRAEQIPAYRTSRVWKIGSGDCFVAYFANAWMHGGLSPVDAAKMASRATAYYCETQGFPSRLMLDEWAGSAIEVSDGYASGKRPQVYLAGPFFDLAQVWMVEQAYATLKSFGLLVFSPYHDIGLGSAEDVVEKDLEGIQESDLLFAITDGLDAGTIYEIGYARALGKPVVVYSERHLGESLKMMDGSACTICTNYTTAVYSTLWEAVKL